MALDRTNMVSLLDTGLLNGGTTSDIDEIGDGFTELEEDWGPDTEATQYINMKSKATTVKGYEFSMEIEREYLSDDMQTVIDNLFKSFPTGKDCETFYYRYYKTDLKTSGTEGEYAGDCIKVPVVISPSTTGGAGGDTLVSKLQINGNGDPVEGTITVTSTGYTFVEK